MEVFLEELCVLCVCACVHGVLECCSLPNLFLYLEALKLVCWSRDWTKQHPTKGVRPILRYRLILLHIWL